MRLAVSRAVAVETSRGWRIAKEKQSHKIDVVVALGMAALGAVKEQSTEPPILTYYKQTFARDQEKEGLDAPAIAERMGEPIEKVTEWLDKTWDNELNDAYLEEIPNASNTCGYCAKLVGVAGVDWNGRRFHKDCFPKMQQKNGPDPKPPTDVSAAKVCEFCKLQILGTSTDVGSRKYHPECFRKVIQ